jgi:hypothetical protein
MSEIDAALTTDREFATAGSERELLGSVVNELVKWGGRAMRRRPSSRR